MNIRFCFLLFLSVALLVGAVRAAEKDFYSPDQIRELISSGNAKPHGAQFANQGLGCKTFLWQKSDDKHIFFFTRNGNTWGEYRDETLDKGRFLRIDEMYLILLCTVLDLF